MIFKNWFKPKWQHPDFAVRQLAIASLSSSQLEHKAILHELAFNDSSETVRRSALEQLNDFSLWWQASKQDNTDKLRQFAEQQLLTMLLTQQISASLKRQFVAQCNRMALLEQLAERETDAEVLFSVLERLNKPDLNIKALLGSVLTIAQKQQLLAQLDDQKQLEKLSKLLSGELAGQLQQMLTAHANQQQKPPKLRKDLTLLLARLNALRERFAVADIPEQFTALQQQWQQYQTELHFLPTAEAESISNKYQQLVSKLDNWLAPQLKQIAAVQAAAVLAAEAAAQYQQFSTAIAELTLQLSTALASTDISKAENITQPLALLTSEIANATLLSDVQRSNLTTQLSLLTSQLTDLAQTAEKLTEAAALITDWAAQALPTELTQLDQANQQFADYKRTWLTISRELPLLLPAALSQAKQQLQQQWQQSIAALTSQREQALRQCRSKLAEFKRLDQQGRYKVLFGLFKGICSDYVELTPSEQQKLATEVEAASARVTELANLQAYIAAPRKQELLTEMQLLLQTEPTDMPARAEQVKYARQQWGSYGKAAPEQDAELNQAFDSACEQAYAPCRRYFAEQDELKAANLAERAAIVNQLEQLASQELTPAALDSALKATSQAWQQAGAVKRQDFLPVQQRYQQALNLLKAQASVWQQHAASDKQALIAEGQAALSLTDTNQTSKILKELQQRWKQLGYAGKKHDQQLWQQLRQLCDGFFNQRQVDLAEQQQQQRIDEQALNTRLAEIEQAVNALTIASASTAFTAVSEQLQTLDVGVNASARKQRDKLQQQLTSLQQQQASQAASQGVINLFKVLQQADTSTDAWPVEFKPQPELAGALKLDRLGVTQALEIIAGISGPEQESSQRQQVQLTLLTLKHNAGEVTDKPDLLRHWLAFGPVTAAELSLVSRIKAAYLE